MRVWLRRLAGLFRSRREVPPVQTLVTCLHPSWGPCTWRTYKTKWGWWTQCTQCGIYARC